MTTLHQLTEDDVQYCDNRNRAGSPGLLRSFSKNFGNHEMTVMHDEGLYRHLRFKNPKNGFYWFDLITWPGNLTITGDMGTYAFARLEDMFDFFTGYINTDYWAEKLKAGASGGRSEVKNYDESLFKQWLVQDFWQHSRDMDHDVTTAWWGEIKDEILGKHAYADISSPDSALRKLHRLGLPRACRNHYDDAWEAASAWMQYDWHVEVCLAAIVAGIRTYNEHAKTEQLAAKENTK
ncbi:hypothetical protein [Glutamicibacter ardleyensis]|uniref:hypothetical protein n=1 Tax=Glutamicibacter ardleyensis TaxID=225894 RepID=UPI003FD5BE0D